MTDAAPREVCLAHFFSPAGELLLASLGGELILCDWVHGLHRNAISRRLEKRIGLPWREAKSAVIAQAERELAAYFAGECREFRTPIRFVGTPFQTRVWEALLAIPFGETRTYSEIAAAAGSPRAVRAAGTAIGENALSIIVPCHRVIANSGALAGYGGGLAAKRLLLQIEGALPTER